MPMADTTTPVGFRRILFATDLTVTANSALLYAARIARRCHSTLYLGHIMSPEHWHLVPPQEVPHVFNQNRHAAERQFSKMLNSEELLGVAHEVLITRGLLRRVLPELIEKHEIDLIVMAARRHEGFPRLLLGSTAEAVLEATSCPVVVVGPHVAIERAKNWEPNEVLFPTDFGPQTLAALPYALSLSQTPEVHLTLLHVAEGPPRDHLRDPDRIERYLQTQLKSLVTEEAELFHTPEFLVRFGSVVSEVVDIAAGRHIDLIVLGERRPGLLSAHLMGDTTHEVISRAPCPVLMVCRRDRVLRR